MQLPEIVLALRAVEEGDLHRDDLPRLCTILESWDRADLKVSCGEVLVNEFRIPSAKVRRWEEELGGQSNRRVGKYELRRRIGQGGMGIVFEAVHPNLDRPVALKILPPSHGKNPEAVQRFLTETKSAGRFNDPHIVHAYDAGIDGDIPFLVMEYIDGENLFQVLQRAGRFEIDVARDLLQQAAHALLVLEEAGWVHGDGKPSNWMIDGSGTLKLADLGLCRPPGRPGGTVFGSPPYIAPELMRPGTAPDHRVDLYSLGATFYHLLTGRPPYKATTVSELARSQKTKTIVPPQDIRAEIPDDLARLLEDLLQADPEERISSSREVLARLGVVPAAAAQSPVVRAAFLRPGVLAIGAILLVGVGYALARAVFPAGETEPVAKPGQVPTAVVEVVPQTPDAIFERWRELWAMRPHHYAQLAGWLEGEGAAHAQFEAWRGSLQEALEEEAAPVWADVAASVAALTQAGRHGAALDELADFPPRLRAGRYFVVWEQAQTALMQKRERVAIRVLLEIRTALELGDTLRARRAFTTLAQEPEGERAWLRARVADELGGLPWLNAAAMVGAELAKARQHRRDFVIAELQRGVIPEARPGSDVDLAVTGALMILTRSPEVVLDPAGSAWERLYRSGCLAHGGDSQYAVWVAEAVRLLEADNEPTEDRNAEDECHAARLQQQARTACEQWEVAAAESAWEQLFRYPGCLATVNEQLTVAARRAELKRGAFLRSGAFAGAVAVHWGAPPAFTYTPKQPLFFQEWRSRDGGWQLTDTGLRSRAGAQPEPIELIIPFDGALRVEVGLELPDQWVVAAGYGDTGIALGRRDNGIVNASMGATADVIAQLKSASHRWPRAAAQLASRNVILTWALSATWSVEVGNKVLALGKAPSTAVPRWLTLTLSRDVVITSVTVVGAPNTRWLHAREQALSDRASESKGQ